MKTIYCAICALLLISLHTSAQLAGTLDPSFAAGGKLVLSINPGSDRAQCVSRLQDGSFLVGGYTYNSITGNDFFCIKVDSNGVLVTAFGVGGKVTTDIQTGSDDRAYSIGLDEVTGKFILAGSSDNSVKQSAVLIRFNTNGTIDSTFGVNGKCLTSFTSVAANKDEIRKIKINYLTGKIIAAGRSTVSSTVQRPMAARYNTDGSLDTSFNHTGLKSLWVTYSDSTSQFTVRDLSVTPAGVITIAGSKSYSGWSARLNGNGTLDATFDVDGVRTCLYMSHINAMYIDPATNYIYTTGDQRDYFTGGNLVFWTGIKRLLPNGSEDSWAGGGGNYCYYSNVYGDECASNAIAAMSDGTYVIAGSAFYGTTNTEVLMMRMLPTGYIDYTFAPAADRGRVSDGYGGSQAEILDMILQPDDEKIVTVGYAGNNLFVTRYFGKTIPQVDSFHLVSPPDLTTHLIPTDLDMVWSPAVGASSYELQYDTTAIFGPGTHTLTYGTDTSTDHVNYPMYLEINHTYWWRVRASDGTTTGHWKGPWSFATVPDSIQLLSPAQHAHGVSPTPKLDWTDVPISNWTVGAVGSGFDIQIDTSSTLSSPNNIQTVSLGTSLSEYQYSSYLQYGQTYYWRVRSTRLSKKGPWSPTYDFNVRFATGIPTTATDSGISFYPNPVHDDLYIIHTQSLEIRSAEAYDELGRATLLPAKGNGWQVSELGNGIYMLKLSTDQGTIWSRFIKE